MRDWKTDDDDEPSWPYNLEAACLAFGLLAAAFQTVRSLF